MSTEDPTKLLSGASGTGEWFGLPSFTTDQHEFLPSFIFFALIWHLIFFSSIRQASALYHHLLLPGGGGVVHVEVDAVEMGEDAGLVGADVAQSPLAHCTVLLLLLAGLSLSLSTPVAMLVVLPVPVTLALMGWQAPGPVVPQASMNPERPLLKLPQGGPHLRSSLPRTWQPRNTTQLLLCRSKKKSRNATRLQPWRMV